MNRIDARRMIQRRAAELGTRARIGCHTFRATGITAYLEALQEFTRTRVPLLWAGAQMNLGIALLVLGERESGVV